MSAAWERLCISAGDLLLGWLLALPRDAALTVISLGSAALLVAIRRWLTDQGLLRAVARDQQRLRHLARSARRAADRPALRRARATRARVARVRIAQEVRPALVSLLPAAVLITWMAARFEFRPPAAGQHVDVELLAPHAMVGDLAHLVPLEDVTVMGGYVRRIASGSEQGLPLGRARWTLAAEPCPEPYALVFRWRDRSMIHRLLVGQPRYEPPVQPDADEWVTRASLDPYRPFGSFPSSARFRLPAWLIAYLVLTAAAFYLAKRVLGVA